VNLLASTSGENAAFLVIGVLGIVLSAAVFLVPSLFDAATRLRLRMQNLPEDSQRTLEKDRQRRRFIATILGIGSTVILLQGLTRL
jgi:hypothetical protein